MIETVIHLFAFKELPEKAQQKAISEHRDFLLSIMEPSDFISGEPEWDTPEKLQEQYESDYEYYLVNDEPIVEAIEANNYYFFFDGELAYTREQPSGKLYIEIHGETDIITMEENNQ